MLLFHQLYSHLKMMPHGDIADGRTQRPYSLKFITRMTGLTELRGLVATSNSRATDLCRGDRALVDMVVTNWRRP